MKGIEACLFEFVHESCRVGEAFLVCIVKAF